MDCAPLNLAHFHERRADKLLKRHRYDEAFKAIETSLFYVEDAYKQAKIPKTLEVLNTQKWDYEKKLNQIEMRKLQYEKLKSREILPSVQFDGPSSNIKTDTVNAQSIARSIDKTIKEFNDKYGSTLLGNMQNKDNGGAKNSNDQKEAILSNNKMPTEYLENTISRLSLLDNHLQATDDELPSLAPLELPSFDYTSFVLPMGLQKNFKK